MPARIRFPSATQKIDEARSLPASQSQHGLPACLLVVAFLIASVTPKVPDRTLAAQAPPSPVVHTIILLPSADTFVAERELQRNWGHAPEMRAGYEGSGDDLGITRALLRFELPSPQITTIHTATLRLCLVTSWDVPEMARIYAVHRAGGEWSELAVTWENAPPVEERYGSASLRHQEWGWYAFDVTRLVRAWQQGILENDGMVLVGPETVPNRRGFSTREGPYPPQLLILYEGEAPTETPTPSPWPTATPSDTATPTPQPMATATRTTTPRPRHDIALPLLLAP